jgi:hypothetical protein
MMCGAVFLDYDLDGRPDLFTANGHLEPDIAMARPGQSYPQPAQLFRNTGAADRLFVPVPPSGPGGSAFPAVVGRGCAYLDFDGDGSLDLVVTENSGPARLYRNDNRTGNYFLRLLAVGNGQTTNRDAIGAEITVEAGGRAHRWYVSPTRGYLSQSERTATFGLGREARAERVTVRWPGGRGRTQEWRDLAAGATYRLIEGVAEPVRVVPGDGRP